MSEDKKSNTAIWVAVIGGICGLCATIVTIAPTLIEVYRARDSTLTPPIGVDAAIKTILASSATFAAGTNIPFFTLAPTNAPTLFPPLSTDTPPGASPTEASTEAPAITLPPVIVVTPTPIPLSAEITDAKGVPMRLVSAGNFIMGSQSGELDEKPAHIVYTNAYYLDKYELSNMLYKVCVDAGVCMPPMENGSYSRAQYYGNPDFNNYPVVNVTWTMAKTYCEWRGTRLPTEAEWEKALRGNGGDAMAGGVGENRVNFCDRNCPLSWANQNYDDGYADTAPGNAYPDALSPYGVYNLSGNVWEWVADWYSSDYYQNSQGNNPVGPSSGKYRVIRGGSYGDVLDYTRIARRSKFDPAITTSTLGFRCARDANP